MDCIHSEGYGICSICHPDAAFEIVDAFARKELLHLYNLAKATSERVDALEEKRSVDVAVDYTLLGATEKERAAMRAVIAAVRGLLEYTIDYRVPRDGIAKASASSPVVILRAALVELDALKNAPEGK